MGASALVTTGLVIATANFADARAGATAIARNHYLPVVGDKQYLVYVKAKGARQLGIVWHDTRRLYVLDSAGYRRFVGSWSPTQQGISLVGSTLVTFDDSTEGGMLTWWDLATATTGTAMAGPDEVLAGAARNGWVTKTQQITATMTPSYLIRHWVTGQVADLGAPLPYSVGYSVTTAGHGLVAFANPGRSRATTHISSQPHSAMPWSPAATSADS